MVLKAGVFVVGVLLVSSGVFAIVRLWQNPPTLNKMEATSGTSRDSGQNRLLLFGLSLVVALCLAAVNIALRSGWHSQSFTFRHLADVILGLIRLLPISILLFPAGLTAILTVSFYWKFVLVLAAWLFYVVTPIYGVAARPRWFAVLYTIFIIILIFNVVGCGPVAEDILSSLNPDG